MKKQKKMQKNGERRGGRRRTEREEVVELIKWDAIRMREKINDSGDKGHC